MRPFLLPLSLALALCALRAPAGAAPTARLSDAVASARAVNRLEPSPDAFRLHHPCHQAWFTGDGVRFVPRRGPAWRWRLAAVEAGGRPAVGVVLVGVLPEAGEGERVVAYRRGPLREEYVPRARGVEQRFVLERALSTLAAEVVVAGTVESAGSFAQADGAWWWRGRRGAVRLGDVAVFDARGAALAARMEVTAESTRIVIPGEALASAAYPVTIDPEIGANDFRISDMGGTGDPSYDAGSPAVAYNGTDDEYLVVWAGDDHELGLVDGELEIFGQRIDATTGAELGANDFRISDVGPTGLDAYAARNPAVAFNPTNHEYLVVWEGDDNEGGLVDGEREIFAQRLAAATGAQVGSNDFRISSMGGTGVVAYAARSPAVAYNATDNEYLVVWWGDDNAGGLVDEEDEIFGQRLDAASGTQVGTNDFRISDAGGTGDPAYGALEPAVTYNGADNEYLVVWYGDDDVGGLLDNEIEIFGQRLAAATGAQVGANDFRITDMGGTGALGFPAALPAVAYNATEHEYLVVWQGEDEGGGLADEEREIFGQRIDAATGVEVGENDFRISDLGGSGDPAYDALMPAVAYNPASNEYLVVWQGDDDQGALEDDEVEIYGQSLTAAGAEGPNDVRLSDAGPDRIISFSALSPAVAFAATPARYLVVWSGRDDVDGLVSGEQEVFGQQLTPYLVFADGCETGDTSRWSASVP